MMDFSLESLSAEAEAQRGALAFEGRECAVCPAGVTEPGEELCPNCEVQFGSVTPEELENMRYAA